METRTVISIELPGAASAPALAVYDKVHRTSVRLVHNTLDKATFFTKLRTTVGSAPHIPPPTSADPVRRTAADPAMPYGGE
eukprot:scaffold321_cov67-Phaeocystis_antarctica.AAC.3